MNNILLINLQKFNIRIAGIYHCRSSNHENFLNRLDFILDNQNKCFIFGDFNLDLFNKENDQKVNSYCDLIERNGYTFLNSISKATRVDAKRKTSTCIDHILTDFIFSGEELKFNVSLDDLFGDHKALLMNISKTHSVNTDSSNFYDIKKVDHSKIIAQNLMSAISTSCFSSFQSDLIKILSQNSSTVKLRERFKQPFMNLNTLNYIKIKQNYLKLLKKYPDSVKVKTRYNYYRNLTNKKVKEQKQKYYHEQFVKCKDNAKETWRNMNQKLRLKKNQSLRGT